MAQKPTPNENDRVFKLKPAQDAFMFSAARYPAYVAAWGTGKTTAAIGRALRLSQEPGNLGLICRKEYTNLRDSTVKDFELYTGYKLNSNRDVDLENGSIIMFRHLDELRNLQNINLGWFWIEQAEEMESDEHFFLLFGRLRRKGFRQSGFITANTAGHNWIYRHWKLGNLENASLHEAKTHDHADVLPKEWLESLELIKKTKPGMYNRFVLNSWEDADTVDNVIQPDWVAKAARRETLITFPVKKIVSIDVARFGDDLTTFYAFENYRVVGRESWEKKPTMDTVGRAVLFAKKHEIEWFAVDEIGVGAGVVDRLMEMGYNVIAVNSSKRSRFPDRYANIRAEVYGTGADLLQQGLVEIQPDDESLMEQLCWAKYKAVKSNGCLIVEPKEDIKKRYQKSPDFADAYLNGLWALEFAEPVTKKDAYAKEFDRLRSRRGFNPMTV